MSKEIYRIIKYCHCAIDASEALRLPNTFCLRSRDVVDEIEWDQNSDTLHE